MQNSRRPHRNAHPAINYEYDSRGNYVEIYTWKLTRTNISIRTATPMNEYYERNATHDYKMRVNSNLFSWVSVASHNVMYTNASSIKIKITHNVSRIFLLHKIWIERLYINLTFIWHFKTKHGIIDWSTRERVMVFLNTIKTSNNYVLFENDNRFE